MKWLEACEPEVQREELFLSVIDSILGDNAVKVAPNQDPKTFKSGSNIELNLT